ncbi:uncharacterized protein TRAVEDRAFT_42515 [Trametes versicolor FP-101664 SS1]|uniref:uncharacterized protein n=1 Tax=Trametes versicolor (strain FP-101664) TaxID=717944 RepID=UPI00046215F3|nr:uncharacterized protein TRAVEDRAFT_42515 [Trametes versicolor FP-101664 SS1]EIW65131.1 hypothetical protein TRAVEDRAFT_42515 [Trametes versicolor FP-101664 SS1]
MSGDDLERHSLDIPVAAYAVGISLQKLGIHVRKVIRWNLAEGSWMELVKHDVLDEVIAKAKHLDAVTRRKQRTGTALAVGELDGAAIISLWTTAISLALEVREIANETDVDVEQEIPGAFPIETTPVMPPSTDHSTTFDVLDEEQEMPGAYPVQIAPPVSSMAGRFGVSNVYHMPGAFVVLLRDED